MWFVERSHMRNAGGPRSVVAVSAQCGRDGARPSRAAHSATVAARLLPLPLRRVQLVLVEIWEYFSLHVPSILTCGSSSFSGDHHDTGSIATRNVRRHPEPTTGAENAAIEALLGPRAPFLRRLYLDSILMSNVFLPGLTSNFNSDSLLYFAGIAAVGVVPSGQKTVTSLLPVWAPLTP